MLEKIRLIRDIILFVIANFIIIASAQGAFAFIFVMLDHYVGSNIAFLLFFLFFRFFTLYFLIRLLSWLGSTKTKEAIENARQNLKLKVKISICIMLIDFALLTHIFKNPIVIACYPITMTGGLLPTYLFTFFIFWFEKTMKIPENCIEESKNFLKFVSTFSVKVLYFCFCAFITVFIIFGLMDFSNLSIMYVLSAISLLIFMWSMFFWKMKLRKKTLCIAFLFIWAIIHLLFTQYPCAEMGICHQGMIRKNEQGERFKINEKTCTQNGYRWNAMSKFCDMNK